MRSWALLTAIVLLTGAIAGCLGGEKTDASPSGDEPVEPTGSDEEQGSSADEDGSQSDDEGSEEGSSEEEEGEGSAQEDEGTDDTEDSQSETSSAPDIETVWFNGTTQGQHVPVAGHFCMFNCDNAFEFEVTDDTAAIVAEIAWEADATIMFDVDIPFEECDAGIGEDCPPEPASGDEGYLTIEVLQEKDIVSGNWTASAWASDSPAQPVDFTMAISLLPADADADAVGHLEGAD